MGLFQKKIRELGGGRKDLRPFLVGKEGGIRGVGALQCVATCSLSHYLCMQFARNGRWHVGTLARRQNLQVVSPQSETLQICCYCTVLSVEAVCAPTPHLHQICNCAFHSFHTKLTFFIQYLLLSMKSACSNFCVHSSITVKTHHLTTIHQMQILQHHHSYHYQSNTVVSYLLYITVQYSIIIL